MNTDHIGLGDRKVHNEKSILEAIVCPTLTVECGMTARTLLYVVARFQDLGGSLLKHQDRDLCHTLQPPLSFTGPTDFASKKER